MVRVLRLRALLSAYLVALLLSGCSEHKPEFPHWCEVYELTEMDKAELRTIAIESLMWDPEVE